MKLLDTLEFNGWESLQDYERNLYESMEDWDIPNEFQGTIKITITYEENE